MLPPFPALTFRSELEEPATSPRDAFVRVRRHRVELTYPNGLVSAPFPYDEAWRASLDAATIAAHYRDEAGQRHVYLRSAFRPPLAFRALAPGFEAEFFQGGQLWELPAGLLEADERNDAAGVCRGAARELAEELGFLVDPTTLLPLGAATFPSPGLCGERVVFFQVEVTPKNRVDPAGDGSALERAGVVADVLLDDALTLLQQGGISDMKTEIGLRRLAEHFAR